MNFNSNEIESCLSSSAMDFDCVNEIKHLYFEGVFFSVFESLSFHLLPFQKNIKLIIDEKIINIVSFTYYHRNALIK